MKPNLPQGLLPAIALAVLAACTGAAKTEAAKKPGFAAAPADSPYPAPRVDASSPPQDLPPTF
jgi:curli biogenesis system outer membrane secretion channel CsgG